MSDGPKPLATWMFEQQKVANDRAYRLQNAAALARATGAIGEIAPSAPAKPIAPTHDWQHSDDLAAHRAMGLEKQYLDAALDKDKMKFQMELRQKYAPKGGGINPLSKLWKEYFDTHDRKDYSSKEQQQAHLAAIVERAKRYPGGARFVEDLAKAKALPTDYAPGQRTSEIPLESARVRADRPMKPDNHEQRAFDAAENRRVNALKAIAGQKLDFTATDEQRAAQAKASAALMKYAENPPKPNAPLTRKNPATGEEEVWMDDEED